MGISDLISTTLRFLYGISHNYGLAILLLTVAIRIVLFPLTWKQARALQEMKFLQPKLKELQEKYKDKPQEYQKRVIDLYREHRINPLSGCWPYLVQLPIILALFNALRNYEYPAERFLWLTSGMGKPDPFYILPTLAGVFTFVQGRVLASDPSQNTMNYVLPVVIAIMSAGFPAGVTLYWAATSVLSILEQYVSRALGGKFGWPLEARRGSEAFKRIKLEKDGAKGESKRDERCGEDGKNRR